MIILIVILVAVIGYVVYTYNSLVSLRVRARNAWSDIDVQLKRRYDLVPNLVAVVKGYASHEQSVLEDVARLRSQAMQQDARREDKTETQFSVAIKSLFAVAESYPELRADKSFRDLQRQLTDVEDHIQSARRYYNAVVRDMNTKREMFPSNIIASAFNFGPLRYFQASGEERSAVHARFGD